MTTPFGINTFFNGLPVRIVNTHADPWFYAQDVACVLGIKRAANSMGGFSELEIVSDEARAASGVVTHQSYGDGVRANRTVILLTEQGVYRLIFSSRLAIAHQFRAFVYTLIKNAKLAEETRLITAHATELAEARAYMDNKIRALDEFKREVQANNPPITVSRKHIQAILTTTFHTRCVTPTSRITNPWNGFIVPPPVKHPRVLHLGCACMVIPKKSWAHFANMNSKYCPKHACTAFTCCNHPTTQMPAVWSCSVSRDPRDVLELRLFCRETKPYRCDVCLENKFTVSVLRTS